MDEILINKLKLAFDKIKLDISTLKSDDNTIKSDISSLKSDLQEIKQLIANLTPNNELKQELTDSNISIGNEGVLRHSSNTTTTLQHRPDTDQTPQLKKSPNKDLSEIKKDITNRFRSLTKQQFRVFSTIYTLEDEKQQAITHKELAKVLKLSQSSVRQYVSELLNRDIPLTKQKSGNNQVFLSIPEEFRNLTLYEKLLKFYNFDNTQKSLFD